MLDCIDRNDEEGILLTVDVEKAFDHSFFLSVLKVFGFEENFIRKVNTSLYNIEQCVMSNDFTTLVTFKSNDRLSGKLQLLKEKSRYSGETCRYYVGYIKNH